VFIVSGDVASVCGEQLEGFGGSGQDADRLRPTQLHRIGVALGREDLGDPVDGGHEPHRIPGRGSGDDGLQPVLRIVGPHVALAAGPGGPLLRHGRVGVQDGRGQDPAEPAPGQQAESAGQLGVELGAGLPRQRPGLFGDPARLPAADLTDPHLGPTAWAADSADPGRRRSVCAVIMLTPRKVASSATQNSEIAGVPAPP
jgi:hypothetical protein